MTIQQEQPTPIIETKSNDFNTDENHQQSSINQKNSLTQLNQNKSNQNIYKKIFLPIYNSHQPKMPTNASNSNSIATTIGANQTNQTSLNKNKDTSVAHSKIPVFRYSPNNKRFQANTNNNMTNTTQIELQKTNIAATSIITKPTNTNSMISSKQALVPPPVPYQAFRSNSRTSSNNNHEYFNTTTSTTSNSNAATYLLQQRQQNQHQNKASSIMKNVANNNRLTSVDNQRQNSPDLASSLKASKSKQNESSQQKKTKILVKKKSKQFSNAQTGANNNANNNIMSEIRRSKSISNDKINHYSPASNCSSENSSLNSHSLSPSLSSSSSQHISIINHIEDTSNIYDFIHLIKKNLKKISQSHSIDELFVYLKDNIKYNGYRNFTTEFLQAYLNFSNKLNSNANNEGGGIEAATSQLQMANKKKVKRSLTQFKPNHPSPNYNNLAGGKIGHQKLVSYDLNGRSFVNKSSKPLDRFMSHLHLLKRLFVITQRDILLKILTIELPIASNNSTNDLSSTNNTTNLNELQRPTSKSLKNLSHTTVVTSNHPNVNNLKQSVSTNHVGKMLNGNNANSLITSNLRKCQIKLYDLNEKLEILFNDPSNCDLKLLSNSSLLPPKYDFYKHGEFVLRLITDLVAKMRMVLLLSEKFFHLHIRFNSITFNGDSAQLHNEELINYLDDLIITNNGSNLVDEFLNNNAELDTNKMDSLLEIDSSNSNSNSSSNNILKSIARKKAIPQQHVTNNQSQKLPKINTKPGVNNAAPQKMNMMNLLETNSVTSKQDHLEAANLYDKDDTIYYMNSNLKNKEDTKQINQSVVPTNNQPVVSLPPPQLMKQDTNDSFIQDTDCSSILSEDSTIYYNETSLLKSKQELEKLNPIVVYKLVPEKKLHSLNEPQQNNSNQYVPLYKVQHDRERLIEEYKVIF
jgi:hypothetical protein